MSAFHELESSTAGIYALNKAFIRLQRPCAFWRPDVAASDETYAVFLHEYAHYIHNFSTIAGICDLLYELRTAYFFLQTVGADGLSPGVSALDEEAQRGYRSTQELRGLLRGDGRLPSSTALHRRGVDICYLGHRACNVSIVVPGQDDVVAGKIEVDLNLSSESADDSRHTFKFGSTFLLEGVAFELECLHLEARGRDVRAHASTVNPVPYKVARHVLEGITGKVVSHAECMRVCLLALQSTDAGASFIEIAEILRDSNLGIAQVLDGMTQRATQALASNRFPLLAAVDDILRGFVKRPLLSPAIRYFRQSIQNSIATRLKDPFFELRLGSYAQGSIQLRTFFQEFPPCAVQVIDLGSHEPAPIEYLWGAVIDEELANSFAGYHAMMDYGLAHAIQGFCATTALKPRACPFAASCSLGPRQDDPERCDTSPWLTFDPKSPDSCWYAAGVAISRGAPRATPEAQGT